MHHHKPVTDLCLLEQYVSERIGHPGKLLANFFFFSFSPLFFLFHFCWGLRKGPGLQRRKYGPFLTSRENGNYDGWTSLPAPGCLLCLPPPGAWLALPVAGIAMFFSFFMLRHELGILLEEKIRGENFNYDLLKTISIQPRLNK